MFDPTVTEAEYQTWFTSTFGDTYSIWHDGLRTEMVTGLTGEARAEAVQMLLFGLTLKDGYAAQALGKMGETSALPSLRAALADNASADSRIKIALAINKLSTQQDDEAHQLISVLDTQGIHWGPKIDAARGLRQFKSQETEDALLRAVERDDEYLVKYHSCESLLVRWGIQPPSISSHATIFALICDVKEGDAITDQRERGKEAARLLKGLKNSVSNRGH